MTGFAGTGRLAKLAFRRDIVMLPVCVFGIAALLAITARDLRVLYPPLQWPAWMMAISPFTQTPKLPGAAVSAGPLLWLCGIALVLSLAGLAGLRRRDIGDLGPTGLVRPLADGLADYIRESNEISQQAALGTTQPPGQPSPSAPPGPPARPG